MINKKNIIKIAIICVVLMFFFSGISKLSNPTKFISSTTDILSQWIHLFRGDGYKKPSSVTSFKTIWTWNKSIMNFVIGVVWFVCISIIIMEILCPIIIVLSLYNNKYINHAFICTIILAVFTIAVTVFAKTTRLFNKNIYSTIGTFYNGIMPILSNMSLFGGLLLISQR